MSASPRRAVTSVPAVVESLAKHAGSDARSLALLSGALLADICKEAQLSLADRVTVETFVARVRAEKLSVGEVADRQEQYKLYPWLEGESRATRLVDRFTADFLSASGSDPFAPLRLTFEANAKAGMISADQSMILSYILYTQRDPDLGRYLLANLLLNVPVDARLAVHNWTLAQEMEVSRKFAVGDAIARLHFPLWPPACAGADALNAKLLLHPAEGAGNSYTMEPLTSLTGAGWLPLHQQTDGAYGVETAPLDAHYAQQLEQLRNEVHQLRNQISRPPRNDNRRQQTQQQQQQHQQFGQQFFSQQHQSQPSPRTRWNRRPTGSGPESASSQSQPPALPALDDIFRASPTATTIATAPPASAPSGSSSTLKPRF